MPRMPALLASLMLAAAMLAASAAAPARAAQGYVISEKGLHKDGRLLLSRQTRVRTPLLRRLFRGWQVRLRDIYSDMDDYTYVFYEMRHRGREQFTIHLDQGRIDYINITGRLIADPHGIRVGDTWARLRRTGRMACEWIEDSLLCRRRGERIFFVFSGPMAADGRHPAGKARIDAIRWQ